MVEPVSLIGAVLTVSGFITFYYFIHEEGMQTRQMGIYVLIKNKMWKEAQIQLTSLQEHLNDVMVVYSRIGEAVPKPYGTFGAYFRAVQDQIDTYNELIDKALVELPPITTGRLRVLSSPTEAEIYIDGKYTELMTPETFKDIEKGTYRITLRRWMPRIKKWVTAEETVTVEVGKRKELLIVLEEA